MAFTMCISHTHKHTHTHLHTQTAPLHQKHELGITVRFYIFINSFEFTQQYLAAQQYSQISHNSECRLQQ